VTTIALRYDLRSAPFAATKHPELYRACLDQVAWADEHGVGDVVVLSEHHAMEDGFIPAPFTMAAAVAARTNRLMISIAAALVPLHDPVRLAEQIAIVDLISGGRMNFVAGAGYAKHEFEMAGVERKERGRLLEEYVEVMLKAWTGEPFEWRGRTVRVTPVPKTRPHPLILMGGSSEAAARRAARLKLPFFPALGDERLVGWYRDEAAKVGFDHPFALLPNGPGFVHVTEDPDAAWEEISRYAWYDADTYRSWQAPGQSSEVTTHASNPEELRKEGIYRVVTPDECFALAEELGPTGTIVLHPLMGGMPVELGWSSLELFREKVIPRLRPPA
jgi:alkanesulfonate monooxygenase SsuD/methylene tetrahydromethanopterin reductase-like flavin-dependent oxidoreductase (luciferase family)